MATGLLHEGLTRSVIGAFYDVYNILGYGFLESVYSKALERELLSRGHAVHRNVAVEVLYKGEAIALQRLDLLVDDILIVEIKATSELPSVAARQLLNYLHATHLEVGLLLYFGPKARFVRLISTSETKYPPNPSHPSYRSSHAVDLGVDPGGCD
jgi:GxxExxY protein